MRKWIILICAVCSVSVSAQETIKLTAAKHNQYGLIYSLPRTVFEIEAEAVKTIQKRGQFYNYAEKFLGVPGAITEDSEHWTLGRVRVSSKGVPDSKQEYLVKFKAGTSPFMYLNKDGLLLSVNTEPSDTASRISNSPAILDSVFSEAPNYSVYSESMLMAGSVLKMAEEAAKQIYKLRESRTDLITGEADQVPSDGEGMRLVLKQLDEQERALVALFMGTTSTEKIVRRFSVSPSDAIDNEVAFRFSDRLGIVKNDNLAGAPVYLSIQITEKGKLPVDKKGKTLPFPDNGLAYCIPGRAQVTVMKEGKELFDSSFLVAQFGVVFGLDPKMFDVKKEAAKVRFYPQTGAIQELSK